MLIYQERIALNAIHSKTGSVCLIFICMQLILVQLNRSKSVPRCISINLE